MMSDLTKVNQDILNPDFLARYLRLFSDLHRNRDKERGPAPHKPVLLLALLDEVERGVITDNLFRITPELVASFRAYWRVLVPPDTWQERIVYPFRYLLQDGFWQLVKDNRSLTTGELRHPTSLSQLTSQIDGGRFDDALWQLLQDRTAQNVVRRHLLQTYFQTTPARVQQRLPNAPLEEEAARLTSQAESPFRSRRIRENRTDEDGYFVRSALFPRVIRSLYGGACAVCKLEVRTDIGGSIVDSAHILPFATFHNNDPRNGIALCKNHHWAFDAGWFTITDEYRLRVSPHLQNNSDFLTPDATIQIPSVEKYAPAPEALAWHQRTVFQSAIQVPK